MSSYQLFGFSDDSEITPLSVGFIVIVGYLVLAEYSLSWLDEACRSTAYAQAVQSLYKELVIMGMSGFILTILLGTNMVDNNAWVYYLVLFSEPSTPVHARYILCNIAYLFVIGDCRRDAVLLGAAACVLLFLAHPQQRVSQPLTQGEAGG